MLTVTQKTFPALLRGAARIGAPSVRHFGDTIGFDKNTHKLIDDQNERVRRYGGVRACLLRIFGMPVVRRRIRERTADGLVTL